ncbi:hypothetical protein KFL_002510150 [Klebsormidium nitens]|uniref:MYND-type domain-containing protein n=1 Tax=Klebsormidium nitens TaxID=105231 RepID=A0A1Y1ICE0_KLENI|nr:hypothetical protein KFL_002510150 [Klebsormidium nitens]|eukprot:GAQ85738.1 hypothetical protein KFL_002510150 [Klebsormidium nitens]
MSYGRLWITDINLHFFGLSESRAFEIAVKNIEEATPSPLESHFALLDDQRDLEALDERLKQDSYKVCCFRSSRGTPVFVWVHFDDHLTPARLILPRFIECLAGALGCAATSTVVIPFSKTEVYAGNCESWESMWFLGDEMALEENVDQIENPAGSGHLTTRPYRVTKLCNDQGLVELEPYPVWGGTLGLQIWEGPVRKTLYPVPKTEDESENLDPYTAEDRGFVCELVEESACFADVCWNCKTKPEGAKLLKCGKCGDVRYCSKECQKLSWQKDHKLECDARKQAAQGSRAVKAGKKKKAAQKGQTDHEKEVRERLAQTIAENLKDVDS